MDGIKLLIVQALSVFQQFLDAMIVIRCLLSWFPINRENAIIRFIYAVTEPIMGPFRRMLDRSPLGGGMGIDFSPILALLVLHMAFQLIITVVASL